MTKIQKPKTYCNWVSPVEKIISKICSRNGIPREKVTVNKEEKENEDNYIEINWSIDLVKFKLGLLKIAYEFATDTVKGYFLKDPMAKTISNILYHAKYENLEALGMTIGSGIDSKVLDPFTHILDFDGDNHYIILISVKSIGLLCFINLFNTFFMGFRISKKNYYIPGSVVIGINNTRLRSFEKITLDEITLNNYSPPELRFKYYFSSFQDALRFEVLQKHPDFNFVRCSGLLPLYDRNGMIIYKDCYEKVKQKQLVKKDLGNFKDEIITNVILDEELFIRVSPTNELIQVVEINIEQKRNNSFGTG